ncbi:MAG: flavin reductase family protein [Candidatus Kryptonium sp.]
MKVDPSKLQKPQIYKLLISALIPRPIALVSTINEAGVVNVAPFSFFGGISSKPPVIYVSIDRKRDGDKKDTLKNIELNGDFVVNIVTEEISEKMNICAVDFPYGVSEAEIAGLTPVKSDLVKSPRILESPVSFECKALKIIEIGDSPSSVVFGEIVMFHIKDEIFEDGSVNPRKLKVIGRLGGNLYTLVDNVFEMKRLSYDEYKKIYGFND